MRYYKEPRRVSTDGTYLERRNADEDEPDENATLEKYPECGPDWEIYSVRRLLGEASRTIRTVSTDAWIQESKL